MNFFFFKLSIHVAKKKKKTNCNLRDSSIVETKFVSVTIFDIFGDLSFVFFFVKKIKIKFKLCKF